MYFLIADTFTDSLARLTGEEQKVVKTTAFDLQLNPASPGMKLHKLLCYADHHDKAYSWAERRKLQTHPRTGAAQLVEIRETVQEVIVPRYVEAETPKRTRVLKHPFAKLSDDELLGFGVPGEWLADVRSADEDSLLALADHLPAEAAEALLELATGGKPKVLQPGGGTNPFEHPDARRRFRVMGTVEELQRALDYPWEKWTIFLHPDQRELVERDYAGPARVTGSAGTGKTIVALHRATHLARTHPDARVLLTTFSDPLAHALQTRLKRLLASEPRLAERIDVSSLDALGLRLHKGQVGPATLADRRLVQELLKEASAAVGGHKFGTTFLVSEWDQVVDASQLATWEAQQQRPHLAKWKDTASGRMGTPRRLEAGREPGQRQAESPGDVFESAATGSRSRPGRGTDRIGRISLLALRPWAPHLMRCPTSSLSRRSTRDLAWRTAASLIPTSLATSAGARPSMTVRQNICQVRSSNSARTNSRARR